MTIRIEPVAGVDQPLDGVGTRLGQQGGVVGTGLLRRQERTLEVDAGQLTGGDEWGEGRRAARRRSPALPSPGSRASWSCRARGGTPRPVGPRLDRWSRSRHHRRRGCGCRRTRARASPRGVGSSAPAACGSSGPGVRAGLSRNDLGDPPVPDDDVRLVEHSVTGHHVVGQQPVLSVVTSYRVRHFSILDARPGPSRASRRRSPRRRRPGPRGRSAARART